MRRAQSGAGRAPLNRVQASHGWLAGALLVVMLVMAACAAPGAPQVAPEAQASPNAAAPTEAAQAAPQTTAASFATAEPGSQEVGASAGLSPAAKYVTHWKGNPDAKVVIIEISDFQ